MLSRGEVKVTKVSSVGKSSSGEGGEVEEEDGGRGDEKIRVRAIREADYHIDICVIGNVEQTEPMLQVGGRGRGSTGGGRGNGRDVHARTAA